MNNLAPRPTTLDDNVKMTVITRKFGIKPNEISLKRFLLLESKLELEKTLLSYNTRLK